MFHAAVSSKNHIGFIHKDCTKFHSPWWSFLPMEFNKPSITRRTGNIDIFPYMSSLTFMGIICGEWYFWS